MDIFKNEKEYGKAFFFYIKIRVAVIVWTSNFERQARSKFCYGGLSVTEVSVFDNISPFSKRQEDPLLKKVYFRVDCSLSQNLWNILKLFMQVMFLRPVTEVKSILL